MSYCRDKGTPDPMSLTAIVTVFVTFIGLALSASMVESSGIYSQSLSRIRRNEDGKEAKASLVPNSGNGPVGDEGNTASKVSDGKVQPLNCSLPANVNDTRCSKDNGYVNTIMTQMSENKGMLLRTLYVSLGVTGIVIAYFVVRSIRLRRRRSKSRKYGIITQHDHGDVEMEPLGDGNDDEDDYTVFEMNGKR